MELTLPCFLIIFIFTLLKLFSNFLRVKRTNLPPGPQKLPLVGSLHHLAIAGSVPHHALRNLARKYGPIMHLQLGEISAVVISSPKTAQEVLKTHDIAFASRPRLLSPDIMTYNYSDIAFAPYGGYWRQMRKICMLELLSAKNVRSFSTIREEETFNLVESIRPCLFSSVNLTQMFFTFANNVVCRAAFGKRCKNQDNLLQLINEFAMSAGGFDAADLFPSIKILEVISGLRSKLTKLHHKIDQVFNNIIEAHEERRANKGKLESSPAEEDLVDVLLRLKETGGLEFPITTNIVKAIILDVFSAGTDTSATTVEFAMSEMMRHPRVLAKAQNEMRQVLRGKERIHERDITQLSYLKMVIKETLRLHPPLPLLLPRVCTEQRDIDGYTIPVNTKVILNVFAINRDPRYWDDPESFIPERFANSGIDYTGTNFEYLPFGGGRRVCPGISFGIANVEFLLAQLLYHFDWKLPNGMATEDLDMTEVLGVAVKRKNKLYLVPTPRTSLD